MHYIAVDHSRVKLIPADDDENGGSDYINASFLPVRFCTAIHCINRTLFSLCLFKCFFFTKPTKNFGYEMRTWYMDSTHFCNISQ